METTVGYCLAESGDLKTAWQFCKLVAICTFCESHSVQLRLGFLRSNPSSWFVFHLALRPPYIHPNQNIIRFFMSSNGASQC